MLLRGSIALTIVVSGAFMVADLAHAQERTGEEIVKSQCVKCHEAGVNGAPRIDDRAAWAPRMTKGLDATVRSAIRGHGKMPARGGLADVTDNELRSAVLYMFYPAGATAKPSAAAPTPPAQDAHRKVVSGIEFDLGISLAETAPVNEPKPSGKGYYYVSVSLHDTASKAEIKDAQVEARAANTMGGDTKKLKAATINNATSYGGFFRMQGREPYAITIEVRRGTTQPVVAKFEFKP